MVNSTQSEQALFNILAEIPDPEIPVITINDLGMLRAVKYTNNGCLVTITPTYTGCPAMGMLEDQIKKKLHDNGIKNVTIETVYSPAWSTDWISEEAKDKMRLYGIAPPEKKANCGSCNVGKKEIVHCPICHSSNTQLISKFGSTACKALFKCNSCKEPFEHFKCH